MDQFNPEETGKLANEAIINIVEKIFKTNVNLDEEKAEELQEEIRMLKYQADYIDSMRMFKAVKIMLKKFFDSAGVNVIYEEIKKCFSGKEQRIEKKLKDIRSLTEKVFFYLIQNKRRQATELITKEIMKENHIYTTRDDQKSEIWIYRDGIYVPNGKTYIIEFCRYVLKEVFTTSISNEVTSKIEADTYINSNEFFSNNEVDIVAVQNGLMDVSRGKLMDFTPEMIFFSKLPVKYVKDVDCPVIKDHFKCVLSNEGDLPLVQEMFGYLLYKEYRFEKAFMLLGNGRNGKGKTLDLMKRFIGQDNCANIPIQQLESDNFAISELFNRMANLSGDLSRSALKGTGNFKSLTGRDLISASRKFLPRINFVNYAKMIFSCNELPRTSDTSAAFWNRWVIIDFPYTFVSKKELVILKKENPEDDFSKYKIADSNIIAKISKENELTGLLNWALDGLRRLIKNDDFTFNKTSKDIKKIWIRNSSSFTAFLDDFCDTTMNVQDSLLPKWILRKIYDGYCKMFKVKQESDKVIKTILNNEGIVDKREQVGEKREHCWEGIEISEKQIEEYRASTQLRQGDQGFFTLCENLKFYLRGENGGQGGHPGQNDQPEIQEELIN